MTKEFLPGNKAPSLCWGYVVWRCQSNGSVWHSSPVRIYSSAVSGPPLGLLENKELDPLCHCRADQDSGRDIERENFYPKDASFRRVPCPACSTAGKLRFA
jgi:hypothetical protein